MHRARPLVLLLSLGILAVAAPDDAAVDKLLAEVAKYQPGQSRAALVKLQRIVAQASKDPKAAKRLAARLAALLDAPEPSRMAKDFACRQLWVIGSADQVPTLARLLADAHLSHMARYALEGMADPAAGAALRAALGTVKGKLLIGVVNSVGQRRDAQAVEALIRLLAGADQEVAAAAATALGKIAGARAAKAIGAARAKATGRFRDRLTQAWLQIGDGLLRAGRRDQAARIFEALNAPSEPRHVRVAAWHGRFATMAPAEAVRTLTALAGGKDPKLRAMAIGQLGKMPGPKITAAISALLADASPSLRLLLLAVLADRGDPAAGPAVAALAGRAQDPKARVAAVRALASLGDATSVPLLAQLAGTSQGDLRNAARLALGRVRGKGVDAAIVAALEGAAEGTRSELVRALRARRAADLVPQVVQRAGADKSPAVRRQCFVLLGDLAGGDRLGALVALALKESDAETRDAAEKAILAVARRVDDPTKRLQPILAAHAGADPATRATTLRVLGRLGGPDALAAVRRDLKHADERVQDTAVRTLANWPDDGPLPDLVALARSAPRPAHRILALRGAIRAIGLTGKRPHAEMVAMYKQAIDLATQDAERKLALAGLANVGHPDALTLARSFTTTPGLKAEAQQAVRKIEAALAGPPIAAASHNQAVAHLAIDKDTSTRWKSLINQDRNAGIWFMLDLRREQTIVGLAFDSSTRKPGDYPRSFEIHVSNSPESWGKPVYKGRGTNHLVKVSISPATGRYLKIASTGSAPNNWSIYDLKVLTR